jgi:uroporphyrinogen-III synthase
MPPARRPRGYDSPAPGPQLRPVVISLRPVGDHAAMRRAAAAHGLRTIALSPWRIAVRDDPDTRRALHAALQAEVVIATSPAAVRAAATLAPLRARRGQRWLAVGSATAAALRRAGIADPQSPERMDSDGLLALPALQQVDGRKIGLLTAPGGRDRIAPILTGRGAQVRRADIYAREPVTPAATALARLRALRAPLLLPVSSGEALATALAALPVELAARLRGARVLAASERLAAMARAAGCTDVRIAAGPRPRQLLAVALE